METEVRRRAVRHQLIGMALRRAKPGTGSSRSFLQRRTWHWPEVGVIAQLDFSTLAVPVVIVGGIATALYMPQRVTFDLDLLVHADDLVALGEGLSRQGFRRESALSIGGESWLAQDGSVLDVIAWTEPWIREALSSPSQSLEGQPVIGLPWLVLMKLKAARIRDTDDVARMVALASEETRAKIRAAVARWQPEDLADFESLVILGELEMGE